MQGSTEETIRQAIATWQTQLLQLDSRNPLLYFRSDSNTNPAHLRHKSWAEPNSDRR
jgi:hypothetical protein